MAWTTPKTWSAGETLTAANFNTHIRDNLNATWRLIARKTADETVSATTTLQNDDHLFFTVATSEVWSLQYRLLIDTFDDFKCAWTHPGGTVEMRVISESAGGTVTQDSLYTTSSPTATISRDKFDLAGGSVNILVIDGMYISTGSGTFQFQWAQLDASGSTVLKTNSHLMGMKLA